MGKIDFDHAKLEFEKYLRNFDLENSKIRLKQEHTFGVVKAADYNLQQGRNGRRRQRTGSSHCPSS